MKMMLVLAPRLTLVGLGAYVVGKAVTYPVRRLGDAAEAAATRTSRR